MKMTIAGQCLGHDAGLVSLGLPAAYCSSGVGGFASTECRIAGRGRVNLPRAALPAR
ncbi:hypothetical protein [Pseudohongiella spirulinae]|uniref:Uncharacterized protein n=1 Tax=Pseudohongiella spirulinae TaxID=1249552 RepID=A0A0S2K9U8_9GAMM|nr:hypothetical protein [Pseudohongiella spirulinae]ALO45095.1 hypothetical protein PS2015_408 [Pseudohongiella spirulinae]